MIKSIDLVTESIRNDPQVIAACEAIDKELIQIYDCIYSICFWPNIHTQIPPLLDVMMWESHVDVWQGMAAGGLDIPTKRQLIMESYWWHSKMGTKWLVEHMAQTVFGKVYVEEWFQYGGNPYRFRLILADQLTPLQLTRLWDAVMAVKNVRSWPDGISIPRRVINNLLYVAVATAQQKTNKIPVATNKG